MADEATPQPVFTPWVNRTSVVRSYGLPAPAKIPTQASWTSLMTNFMNALRSASGSGLLASMSCPEAWGEAGKLSRLASGAKADEPPPPMKVMSSTMITPTTPRPPAPPARPPGMRRPPPAPVERRSSRRSPLSPCDLRHLIGDPLRRSATGYGRRGSRQGVRARS